MIYQNPIITGFNPDPSICKKGEDYYLVTSTFEYFPGIPIYHSKDLIHWEKIGHCITRSEQMNFVESYCSGALYAATIRYHDGVFYVVCTDTTGKMAKETGSGNFLVTATDPSGEWSDPIWIPQGGIDPSLFFDDDGKVYFQSTGGRMKNGVWERTTACSEIDVKTGKIGEIHHIWGGAGGRYPEAPHIYKYNGKYYLMLAEGGTEFGHMVTIARSDSIFGEYEECPYNPILTGRDEDTPELAATGHADIIKDHRGNWWMVFLCYRQSENYFHHLGRETAIVPIAWTEDGWPYVIGGKAPKINIDADLLPAYEFPEAEIRDDFENQELSLEWNFLRAPLEDYKIEESRLVLKCSQTTVEDYVCSSFIGRRQAHFDARVQSEIIFSPNGENEEAGITAMYSASGHYDLFVTKRGGKNCVVLRKRVGDICIEVSKAEISADKVTLKILADRFRYTFMYEKDGEFLRLGDGLTKFLSSEVCGGFTGVYFGLYATSNHKRSENEAKFEYFDYEAL